MFYQSLWLSHAGFQELPEGYGGGMESVLQTANEVRGESTFTSKMIFSASRSKVHPASENDKECEYRVYGPSLVTDDLVDLEKEWAGPGHIAPPLFEGSCFGSSSGHWNDLQPFTWRSEKAKV